MPRGDTTHCPNRRSSRYRGSRRFHLLDPGSRNWKYASQARDLVCIQRSQAVRVAQQVKIGDETSSMVNLQALRNGTEAVWT